MTCESHRDTLLEVLYGEADPVVARRLDEHLAGCADCRDEIGSLRQVRGDLARWELPSGLRSPGHTRRQAWRSAWWQPFVAAAAVLLLAVGGALGLSGSELRYDHGRVSFRLGRGPSDPPPSASLPGVEARLLALEARHRETVLAVKALAAAPAAEPGALLPRVERLIADSEARQALVLEARLEDHAERAEQQRRYDLAQVSAGLSYLDGKTGLQVARTTKLMGQILQASEKR
jgi:hypothetical protein